MSENKLRDAFLALAITAGGFPPSNTPPEPVLEFLRTRSTKPIKWKAWINPETNLLELSGEREMDQGPPRWIKIQITEETMERPKGDPSEPFGEMVKQIEAGRALEEIKPPRWGLSPGLRFYLTKAIEVLERDEITWEEFILRYLRNSAPEVKWECQGPPSNLTPQDPEFRETTTFKGSTRHLTGEGEREWVVTFLAFKPHCLYEIPDGLWGFISGFDAYIQEEIIPKVLNGPSNVQ